MVGLMLWLRYALLRGRPFTSLASIYRRFLKSPGTKAYTRAEGLALFAGAENRQARSVLTYADLLSSGAGQRHEGALLSVMRHVWTRKADSDGPAVLRALPAHRRREAAQGTGRRLRRNLGGSVSLPAADETPTEAGAR